jgi:hypothetical protein
MWLGIVPTIVNFRDKQEIACLIATVKQAAPRLGGRVRLIVVDTLSRAMAGGNENSPDDMGALVAGADRVRTETGAHVCLIHHSGKDDTKGARGHSLLRAAIDTELKIERGEGDRAPVKAIVTKQRDLDCTGAFAFKLKPVELGTNRRGKPITSRLVEPAEMPGPWLSEAEEEALEILNDLLPEGDDATVPINAWREAVLSRLAAEGVTKRDTQRQRWKRGLDGLTKRGIVELFGDNVGLRW